nr:HAD hydrolase-like protein [uncultured Niameybacter sp.]
MENKYIFDLDNTLIYTNQLNNDSYNYALARLNLQPILNCERITRNVVYEYFPVLHSTDKEKIVQFKQQYFINHMQDTIANNNLINFLNSYGCENCILWTSGEKNRVLALINYYKIQNNFKEILYSSKNDLLVDVERIANIFCADYNRLIFFEDNTAIINKLKSLNLTVMQV